MAKKITVLKAAEKKLERLEDALQQLDDAVAPLRQTFSKIRQLNAEQQLKKERADYESFVVSLIEASNGAIKGRIPSFDEWRGKSTRY